MHTTSEVLHGVAASPQLAQLNALDKEPSRVVREVESLACSEGCNDHACDLAMDTVADALRNMEQQT